MRNEKHKKLIKPLIIVGSILVVIGAIIAIVPFRNIQSNLITTMAIKYAQKNNKEAGYTNNSIITFCEMDNILFKGVSLGYEDDSYVIMNVGDNGKLHTNIIEGSGVDTCSKSQKLLMYDYNSPEMIYADIVGSFTGYDVYYMNGNTEVLLTPSNAANYLNVNIGTKITLKFVDKTNSSNSYTALVTMKDANLPVIGVVHDGKFVDIDDAGEIEIDQFDESFYENYQIVGVTKTGQSILLSSSSSVDITKTGKQVITYSYTAADGTTIRKEITFNVKKKDKISITGANVSYTASGDTYDKAVISVSTNVSSDVRFSLNNKDFKYIGNIEVDANGEYTVYAKDVSTGDVSEGHKVLVVDIGKRISGTTNPPSGDTEYRVTLTNANKDKWTKDAQTITVKANKEGLDIYTCVTTNNTCTPETKNTSGSVTVSNNGERVCAKAKDDKKESSVSCTKPVMIDAVKPVVSINTVGTVKRNENNEIISKTVTVGLSVTALSGNKSVKYCTGASTCTPNKKATNLSSVAKLTESGYVCAQATNKLDVEGDVTCQEFKFVSEAETQDETEFNETIQLSYDEAKKELVISASSVGGELSKTFKVELSGAVSGSRTITATLNSNKDGASARYAISGDTDGPVTATVSTVSGPNQQTYSNSITFNYIKEEPISGGSCEIRVVNGNLDASGSFYTSDVEVNMYNLDGSKTVSKIELNSNKVTGNLRLTESKTVHGKMYYTDNSVCEADLSVTINKNDVDFTNTEVSGVSCKVTYNGNTPSYSYSFGFTDNNSYNYFVAKWVVGTSLEEHTGTKSTGSHSTFEEDVMVNVTIKDAEGGSIKQLKPYMASLNEKDCVGYRSDASKIKDLYNAQIGFMKSAVINQKSIISGNYVKIKIAGTSEFDSDVTFKGSVNQQTQDLSLGTEKQFTIDASAQRVIIMVDAYYEDEQIMLYSQTFEVDNVVPTVEVTRTGNTLKGKLKDDVVLVSGIKESGWKLDGRSILASASSINVNSYGNGTYTYYMKSGVDLEGSQDFVVSDLNEKSHTAIASFNGYDKADNAYYGSATVTIEATKDIKSVTFIGTGSPSSNKIGNRKYVFTGITNPAGSSFHFNIKYTDGTSETTQNWNQTIYTRKITHSFNESFSGGKYIYTASASNLGSFSCTFSLSNGLNYEGNGSFSLSSDSRAQWGKLVCRSGSETIQFMHYYTGNIDDATAACKLTGVTDGAKYSGKPNMGVTGGSMYKGKYRTTIVPSDPGTYTYHCMDAFAAQGPDVTFEIVSSSNLPSVSGIDITPSKDGSDNPIALVTAKTSGNASYITEYCLDGSCSTNKQFTITDSNSHNFVVKTNIINPVSGGKYASNAFSFTVPESTFATVPETTNPTCHIDTGSGTVNLVVENVSDMSKVSDISLTIGRNKINNGISVADMAASLGLDDNNTHKIMGSFKYEGQKYTCNADYKYAGSCDLSPTSLTLNGSSITVNYKEKEHGSIYDFDGTIVSTNLGTITSNNLITLNSTNYENKGTVKIKKDGCNPIDLNFTYYYYDDGYHNEARPEQAACKVEISNAVKNGNLYSSAYVTVSSDPLAKNVKLYVDDKSQIGLSINALKGTHSYKCGSTGYGTTNYGKVVYSEATTIEVDDDKITLEITPKVSSDKKHFDVQLTSKLVNGGTTVNSSDVTYTMDGKAVNGTVTNLELSSQHTFVATYKNGYSVSKTYKVPDAVEEEYKAFVSFTGFSYGGVTIIGAGDKGSLVITDSKNKNHNVSDVSTKVEYYLDGSKVESLSTNKTGNHVFSAVVTLIDGKEIRATAASVFVDTKSPVISNVSFSNGKLSFKVEDDSGIDSIGIGNGKRNIKREEISGTSAVKNKTFSYDISESELEGSSEITIIVYDLIANHSSTSISTNIILDAECSLDTNIHPKDGYYSAKPIVTISFSNADGKVFTNDLKDYGIKIDNGSSKKSLTINTEYGNHTYVGSVKSNKTTNECSLTLDLKEEFVDIEKPSIDGIVYDSLNKTLTVTASDDKSGIDHYSITGVGQNTSGVFTNVKPGKYTIFVYDKVSHSVYKSFEAKEGAVDEGESSCSYVVRGTKINGYYDSADVSVNAFDKGVKITDLSSYTSATNYLPGSVLQTTGEYSYSLSFKDSNGKTISCKTEKIKIDAEEPVLTVTSNSSTGSIYASATDSKSGMKTVKVYFNGTNLVSAGVGAVSYNATKNGTYIIEATDNLGNETVKSITIKDLPAGSGCSLYVDASYQANTDGWYKVVPVIRYTKTGLAELQSKDFRLNGISKGTSITNVKLGDGTNTVSVYQTEKDGVSHSECSVTVKVDTKAPTVSIKYNESRKVISYSVSDSLSKIASATIYNGSTSVWSKENISMASGELSNVKTGTYKIVAIDKVGNSSEAIVTVTVAEPEKPAEKGTCTVNANSTPNASGWYTTAPTMGINVTKLPTGEYPKRTCVDRTSTSCNQASVVASEGINTYKGTVQTNLSTFECTSSQIKVDTKLPVVAGAVNGAVIGFSASDSGSGIKSIEIYLGSTIKKSVVNATSGSYTATESGTYTITAKDVAGNTKSTTVTVTLPQQEPEAPTDEKYECSFNVSGTGSNGWYRSNVSVTLNVPSGATSAKLNRTSTLTQTLESGSKEFNGNYTLNGHIYTCKKTINIDKDAPTVGKAYSSDTGILAIHASDTGSGISNIKVMVNGMNVASVNSNSLTYKPTITGTYVYYVNDKAGNTSSGSIVVSQLPSQTTTSTACTISLSGGTKGNNDWYTSAPSFSVSVNGTDGIKSKTIVNKSSGSNVGSPVEGAATYTANVTTNNGAQLTCNDVVVKLDTKDPVASFSVGSSGRLASNSNFGTSGLGSYSWTIGGNVVNRTYAFFASFVSSSVVTLTVTDNSGRSDSISKTVKVTPHVGCNDGYTLTSVGKCYKGPVYEYGAWTTTYDKNISGTATAKNTCANASSTATSCEIITINASQACQYGMGLGSSCYHHVKKTRSKTLVSAAESIDAKTTYTYSD